MGMPKLNRMRSRASSILEIWALLTLSFNDVKLNPLCAVFIAELSLSQEYSNFGDVCHGKKSGADMSKSIGRQAPG
jgi:hypothetical protein